MWYDIFQLKVKRYSGSELTLQQTPAAVAAPTRRRIPLPLRPGCRAAGETGAGFDISGAAGSRHLAVLRGAEPVRGRREGRRVMDERNAPPEEAAAWFRGLTGGRP